MIKFIYEGKTIIEYSRTITQPLKEGEIFIYKTNPLMIKQIYHEYKNIEGGSGLRNIYIETTVILH